MTEDSRTPQLTPAIQTALHAVRRRIRGYVWIEGLAVAMAWLGVAFWIGLAIDWFFESPVLARRALLAFAAAVAAGILYWLIARRRLVRLSNRSMAMLLERKFPQFQESLMTAVELTEHRLLPSECNPLLLARACRQADETIPAVRLAELFNPTPLRRSLTGATLLVVSIALLALVHPAALDTWARRNLLMSDELWPRQTRLLVDGFTNGVVKVARGTDLGVIAKADLSKPLVPQTVEIRYRTEEGARGRAVMSREGAVNRARDRFQEFSHTFRGVLTPISFDVVGGDDAVRGLRIEVVENPTIVAMTLECSFPAYTARPPRSLSVSGPMQIPDGTKVMIHARANKDLAKVTVQSALDDPSKPPHVVDLARQPDRRGFVWEIRRLASDQTLLFTLFDTDGIHSREPVRLNLACVADEAPKLALRLVGIGPAITAAARLPVAGHVTDDYGVAKTWFEYAVDQQSPQSRAVFTPKANLTDLTMNEAFEVDGLKLKTGQKLLLAAKAADRCNLGDKPNIGTSERWLLDVVTAEQLRTMLESRELVLRQRFETIVAELSETRDSLAQIDFDTASRENREGSEPDDQAARRGAMAAQALGVRTLRVERALQNSRKDAHEVLGVSEAFGDIREELVNNRIDTAELRMRLEQGIRQPLQTIAEQMFPDLDRRLGRLAACLADPKLGPQSRDAVGQQCDAILLAMRQVLERMLELENFNEALELLRGIIASQEKLNEQTQQRHKQTLRELLEK